jgi:hypothetical protein
MDRKGSQLENHDNELEAVDVDILFVDRLQRDAVLDTGSPCDIEPKLQRFTVGASRTTAGVANP